MSARTTDRSPADVALRITRDLPEHLLSWQLPPEWRWGAEGVWTEHRHYQEVVDALGRSLSLVTAPDPAHADWLAAEARVLARQNHPSIPVTYHYWARFSDAKRGPGYLRRWVVGETVGARLARRRVADVPEVLQMLRAVGSALVSLHDAQVTYGALSPETVWATPAGRTWLLGWQWVVPRDAIPTGVAPDRRWMPVPPEWPEGEWTPTPASDQWQLGALCFAALTGELPPPVNVPPLLLLRPEVPQVIARLVERALATRPETRFPSVTALLRAVDKGVGARTFVVLGSDEPAPPTAVQTAEAQLRWATGDDYEILTALGAGTFGSVWRVRDLTLGREVALKMLHPHIARDVTAVERFHREARLAAQLAHPAIVPIYDWDSRGEVTWYTMELAEGGSLADLIARSGPRPLVETAPQVEQLLDALAAAHGVGIIHRDIKPENILIGRYSRWRLTDFGIANATGEDVGGSTGTPAFAAPEQLLGEPQGPAADCYAMAGIVYFALTGELPFGGGDGQQILARQLTTLPALVGVEPAVGEWIRRGLTAEPEDRFHDASEMQGAWQRAVEASLAEGTRRRWWRWSRG